VEDELAAGGGGVDRLLEAAEADAALGEAGDGVNQVPQGAAEPVELPDDQGVAGTQLVEHLGEDGAVGAGAAGGLGQHPVAAGALEGVDLELGLLVGGGDAGIAEQVTHAESVAELCDRVGCATLISDTDSGHRWWPWRRGSGGCRRNAAGLKGWLHHLRVDGWVGGGGGGCGPGDCQQQNKRRSGGAGDRVSRCG
jgi:hypothetical protein